MEGNKVVELICYNWMPTIADHVMDLPESFYQQAGTSRMHSVDNFNPYEVGDNDLIFVKTDYIVNGMFANEILDKIYRRFNIITGVSSHQIGQSGGDAYKKILNHPNLNKWICTNPPNDDSDKIIPIPIGFEEPDRPGGNQELLLQIQNNRTSFSDKKDLVFLPYHTPDTNFERQDIAKYLKSLPFVEVQEEKQSFEQYLSSIDKYKFVIGLQGSGPDIHRNYEAMLVGSIPINVSNIIEKVFDFHKAEGIFLNSWQDLSEEKFNILLKNEYNIDNNDQFLKIENHISLIKDLI
jgi:hypothetical protein